MWAIMGSQGGPTAGRLPRVRELITDGGWLADSVTGWVPGPAHLCSLRSDVWPEEQAAESYLVNCSQSTGVTDTGTGLLGAGVI